MLEYLLKIRKISLVNKQTVRSNFFAVKRSLNFSKSGDTD